MSVHVREFSDQESLTRSLCRYTGQALTRALSRGRRASLAVSGGRTPVPLFRALAELDLEWPQVVITLVDDRLVGTDHPDSNEKLVRDLLLQKRAKQACFVPLRPEAGCHRRLQQEVPRPHSLLILGMGKDGHTASLFPGAPELNDAVRPDQDRLCLTVTPPRAPHQRLSMTLNAILNSDRIALHLTGLEKRRVLDQALAQGPAEEMPIRYVLNQERVTVTVFWAP